MGAIVVFSLDEISWAFTKQIQLGQHSTYCVWHQLGRHSTYRARQSTRSTFDVSYSYLIGLLLIDYSQQLNSVGIRRIVSDILTFSQVESFATLANFLPARLSTIPQIKNHVYHCKMSWKYTSFVDDHGKREIGNYRLPPSSPHRCNLQGNLGTSFPENISTCRNPTKNYIQVKFSMHKNNFCSKLLLSALLAEIFFCPENFLCKLLAEIYCCIFSALNFLQKYSSALKIFCVNLWQKYIVVFFSALNLLQKYSSELNIFCVNFWQKYIVVSHGIFLSTYLHIILHINFQIQYNFKKI